ncbi:MAG: 3TM-type holin [Paraclostridium sp.]
MIDIDVGSIGNILTAAREAITGEKIVDPIEKAKIDLQLENLNQALINGQLLINQEEAKHPSLFVSGWRPFIGWVCGTALAFQFLVTPILMWVCLALNVVIPIPPTLDLGNLMTILGGLLGLGTLRTFEKVKKVERNK